MNILNQPKLILTKNYIMKKTLLTLAAIAVVAVACDDDDTYVIPTPVDRVVVGFNGDTTVNTISLSSVATDMPTVTAVAFPDDATNKEIYWISSEPGVIEIDSKTGVMTRTDSVLTQISTVVITARAVNALDGTATITLGRGEFVEGVAINGAANGWMDISATGDIPAMAATVSPSTVLDKTVTWRSSNPDVLAVNAATGAVTRGSTALTAPAIVTISATAANGVKDEIQVKIGEGELPETLAFEGEDWINSWSATKAGAVFIQDSWDAFREWSGRGHLRWDNPSNEAVGQVFTVRFNSTIDNKECKVVGRFTTAQDFGIYSFKINGQTVATDLDFRGGLHAVDFTLANVHLIRGENTFEATCTGKSNLNGTFLGIDKVTFDVIIP